MHCIRLSVNGSSWELQCEEGELLSQVIQRGGVDFSFPCGGQGICGKCKVQVTKGNLPPLLPEERNRISQAEEEAGIRLACLLVVTDDMDIMLQTTGSHTARILSGHKRDFQLSPVVEKRFVTLSALDHQIDDLTRLAQALGKPDLICTLGLLQNLPVILRQNHLAVTAVYYGNQLLALELGDTSACHYGVAVDIGTTTVVMYLLNLQTGQVLDTVSRLNAQRPYGDSVISRISYCMDEPGGRDRLQAILAGQLNAMLAEIMTNNHIARENVYVVSLAANTILTHFLLGIPAEYMASAPFTPAVIAPGPIQVKQLGLPIQENGILLIAPAASAYVGGDILAGIVDCRMERQEKLCLLIDIGTNGEIALGNRDGIYCCATAAGPAFEGGHIQCGMGGVAGAINRFAIENGQPVYETIGGIAPKGICGSGVLDVVNALLQQGIIDETGRMEAEDEINGHMAYKIADGVYFTQKDVREVQLAKAAIAAGIKSLLHAAGAEESDVETVWLAGGFGHYMGMESALGIGLLPEAFGGRIISAGNTAGSGAVKILLDAEVREALSNLSGRMTYIELSESAYFQARFVEEMGFPEM